MPTPDVELRIDGHVAERRWRPTWMGEERLERGERVDRLPAEVRHGVTAVAVVLVEVRLGDRVEPVVQAHAALVDALLDDARGAVGRPGVLADLRSRDAVG